MDYSKLDALLAYRFFVTMFMACVTATLFLRTNLHPDSVTSANSYFSVVFFSLISLLFDGFAEETITVSLLHVQNACFKRPLGLM